MEDEEWRSDGPGEVELAAMLGGILRGEAVAAFFARIDYIRGHGRPEESLSDAV